MIVQSGPVSYIMYKPYYSVVRRQRTDQWIAVRWLDQYTAMVQIHYATESKDLRYSEC